MRRPALTIRGRRLNGLPVGTLICMVAVLNMARHGGGTYVEMGLGALARGLSERAWGGSWWRLVCFRGQPPQIRGMRPTGAWLS